MKIFDASKMLEQNYQINKPDRNIVFHWTGEGTIASIIKYLTSRLQGKGTVGYNFMIDFNGDVVKLCPLNAWFHNSGKGTNFDSSTISIAFLSSGAYPTKQQIKSCITLLQSDIAPTFNILEYFCHSELCDHKIDFPADYWRKLKHDLDLS